MQDLESDLGDGLVLLKLLEALSPDSRVPGRYVCCMCIANASKCARGVQDSAHAQLPS